MIWLAFGMVGAAWVVAGVCGFQARAPEPKLRRRTVQVGGCQIEDAEGNVLRQAITQGDR